ncbi:RGS domain-containing protein [Halteromyces radiatus]|uniref:RGS domain-containing protein n=1 Tax=Halteromyces radiatus TaxID=101107 RepID=UPI00221F4995|nr:RGS domain-containing protein [Halteromyces radiatus]KAI8088817.1 RGS domain-containing protein [Halteromyces radiatus]
METPSQFTPSLPHTLEQLLGSTESNLFQDFQQYLEQSFCCENLYFWLDVQEYIDLCRQLDHDGFQFSTKQQQEENILFHVVQQKCHAMIDTYIRPNSNQEINIPCELRQDLLDQVFGLGNYHPQVFAKSTKSVLELMRVNAFIPWISSYMASPLSPPLSSTITNSPFVNPLINGHQLPLSPTSPCRPKHRQITTNTDRTIDSSSNDNLSSTQSSPTSLSFSFMVDKWNSFNRMKSMKRSNSMDSTTSVELMDESQQSVKKGNMDMTTCSPPPSPTVSSPPASTRYKSMLQRVKSSFLPNPSTIKPTTTSWKKDQQD